MQNSITYTNNSILSLLLALLVFTQIQAQSGKNKQAVTTQTPDYTLSENWSALPFRTDAADYIPKTETWVSDSLKQVDVFYVYPTIYTNNSARYWNADVADEKLNKKIDRLPVKYQASVFNKDCRVYAPRYRQAHIDAYSDTTENKKKTFDLAYNDVKAAFEYYLKHYNQGRPIIIASHSQGTTHCRNLIRDFFDSPQQKQKLVAAYIIGYKVNKASYTTLTPCQNATETNCYITWASYHYKAQVDTNKVELFGDVCVNPISWQTNNSPAESNGSILLDANKRFKTIAFIKQNYLAVKTKTPVAQSWKVMHLVDYNLFWYNIRENVADRIKSYTSKTLIH